MRVMLRLEAQVCVRVLVGAGLETCALRIPKARLVGAKVTAGTIPVPASDTDRGLPGASSVMVTVAVRAPAAAGVNVTVKAQLAPAATGPPAGGQGATAGRASSRERAQMTVVAVSLKGEPRL